MASSPFYNKVIFQGAGLRKTLDHIKRISAVVYGRGYTCTRLEHVAIHLNSQPDCNHVRRLCDLRQGANKYNVARSQRLSDQCGNLSRRGWQSHLGNMRHMIRKARHCIHQGEESHRFWYPQDLEGVVAAWFDPFGSCVS